MLESDNISLRQLLAKTQATAIYVPQEATYGPLFENEPASCFIQLEKWQVCVHVYVLFFLKWSYVIHNNPLQLCKKTG